MSTARTKLVLVALTVTACLLSSGKTALAGKVDPTLQTAIIAKLASYDSSIKLAGKELRIAVLSDENSAKSAAAIVKAFDTLRRKNVTVKGRKLRAVLVSDNNFSGARLVYIPSSHSNLATLAKSARAAGVPSISDSLGSLSKGISLCVLESKGRPSIHISKSGVKGLMSIDSKLLRLAKLHP
mgnify:CR=1 FL=1